MAHRRAFALACSGSCLGGLGRLNACSGERGAELGSTCALRLDRVARLGELFAHGGDCGRARGGCGLELLRAKHLALALRNRRRRDSCALGRTLRGKSEGLA